MIKMEVPFHKPYISKEEIDEVINCLKDGWITMGQRTVEFEKEFSQYIGCKNSIAVNSCTSALHLALRVIGLKENDEVIVPTLTFTATGEVVCYFKAKPVLVDVEEKTHNIDVNKIEKQITKKTKVIIPVHYGGQSCDMDEIIEIARKYNIYVIEDAAHALPSLYKGKKIGTIGDITCFSFYATKTLTTGEGGMITTENENWTKKIKILRLHGISEDAWKRYSKEGSWYYEVVELGYKYNTTDINSALGLSQLKKVEIMWKEREKIAQRYNNAFRNSEFLEIPYIKPDRETSWHLYVIKLNLEMLKIDRNEFIEKLKNKNIGTSVHFIPLYRHPYYLKNFTYNIKDFPVSEKIYPKIVSLPIYPGMTEKHIDYVIDVILDVCKKFKR